MKKLLVIDDEATLSNVLVDKFNQEGFVVRAATNGLEGLNMALKEHPDLILLDIIMPVMDGMTMLAKLRKDPWGKTAKVILLTNLSDAVKVNESINQGVRDYLIKCDWTLDDIVKKVNDRLS